MAVDRTDQERHCKGKWRRVVTVTAAYTATLDDDVIICAGVAPFTVTLPTAASAWNAGTQTGKELTFINIDANDATLDGAGTEEINGATEFVLDVQYEAVTIVSNGTAWYAV